MKTKILVIVALSAIFLLGSVPGCLATDRYVNQDGTCSGNLPCYTTIQAAVNAASAGDTIYVAAGTYNENVNIPAGRTGLQLIGEGKEITIIAGVSQETIKARSAVTIQGFNIKSGGSTKGIRIYDTADGTEANPGIIRDNKIEGFTGAACYGVGFATQPAQVEWWSIMNNEFCNDRTGIYFEDACHILVSENTFTECYVGCGGVAGNGNQIVWNTFAGYTGGSSDCHAIGFCAEKPTNLNITNNIITGYDYGIRVFDCSGGVDCSVQVHCNNLLDNCVYDIENLNNDSYLDATNNWWGDASGPISPNPGNSVSDYVTYDPWLPTPFQECPECGGIKAPAISTLGVVSLIGLLSVVLAVAIILRKRE
jgi:hypothetical protein